MDDWMGGGMGGGRDEWVVGWRGGWMVELLDEGGSE